MDPKWACLDGNEAAAIIAHKLSEVIAIYPITPASPMGELADAWSASGRTNLWGIVPEVVEMQSEGGAAGTVHGALIKGALATTFTASQGLLLMLPNMYKIAGELLPGVIHVAARTVATHALSIFGDHSDVMAARATGFTILASSSVQEAHDLALVAHAAALESWVPVLHFFDGFRTSHEVNKIRLLDDSDIKGLIDESWILEHRMRGLSPDRPSLRGSAQNPDVFFQAREASNTFYEAVPEAVQGAMDKLARSTGRSYHLVDYVGAPDADRVVVIMGSGAGAAAEAVDNLTAEGEKVGLLTLRLFRPFPGDALLRALPPTVERIAVMDRTKEPGALGEPLYQDVLTAFAEGGAKMPLVIGGRYGLASKEFTPAMVARIFEELRGPAPHPHFTVGITDDVTQLSLAHDPHKWSEPSGTTRALFFGLGSDGTVGASKNTVKIVAENTDLYAQGYFVYDSKKAGSITVSHLRFGPEPIHSTYLVSEAQFVGCHHFALLERLNVLDPAADDATFLLNSPYAGDKVWDKLPREVQEQIIAKRILFYVVDARKIATSLQLGVRINTVMQSCFFALAGMLDMERARNLIRASIEKTFGRFGLPIVERNFAAVDAAVEALQRVEVPAEAKGQARQSILVDDGAPDFVQKVTARLLEGKGDLLPVSALPVDGVFPTGTARFEKRGIADELPLWDPEICIDCGHCVIVCPHNAVQMKVYDPALLAESPDGFKSKEFHAAGVEGKSLTVQIAPDDCTGCGVCVDVCPVKSKSAVGHKALNMAPSEPLRDPERANFDFFLDIPFPEKSLMDRDSVKGSQIREPLFEFSGACAGCGETPYLKLITQLFGDRLVIANATGCSSIYGGNLPTTPWTVGKDGRGPAWANSLFEDNAEFGLGFRLAADRQKEAALNLLTKLKDAVGADLVREISTAQQLTEAEVDAQRARVARLKTKLTQLSERSEARALEAVADELVDRSVWIVGGDGWAYDIGSAGLDHVLASGKNVNVLLLDTEVYSNTGGQVSKSTPRGAVAKFASSGKKTPKKDLGMMATQYGNVYVAQVALGANYKQTIKALLEAEAWPGPSLVIAYSTCIAHGIDMSKSMSHQKDAVRSGYWPLYRFHPGTDEHSHPLKLDSKSPSIPLKEFVKDEARFAVLERRQPDEARRLMQLAQADVDERWRFYEQTAGVERTIASAGPDGNRANEGEA